MLKKIIAFFILFSIFTINLYSSSYYLKKYNDIYLIYSKSTSINKNQLLDILSSLSNLFLKDANLKIQSISIIRQSQLGKSLYKRVISADNIFKSGYEYLERPRYEIRIIVKEYATNLKKYINGFQIFIYDYFKKDYKLYNINEDKLCLILSYKLFNASTNMLNTSSFYFECLGRRYQLFIKDSILTK